MLREVATVIAREGDSLLLECQRQSSCGSCASKGGCGTAAVGNYVGKRPILFRVNSREDYRVGERLELGLSESGMLRGSFLLYLFPLLVFILLIGLLQAWGSTEGWSLLAAVIGMGLSFWLVGGYTRGKLQRGQFEPVILGRADKKIQFINKPL